MRICYIDESGDTGTLTSSKCNIQPALVIIGLMVDQREVHSFTREFIHLKKRFFPGLRAQTALGWILAEVKGSEIRKNATSSRRRERRQSIGFMDCFLRLLLAHRVEIAGRVWVKSVGVPIDQWAIYTSSVQAICSDFQHYLELADDAGLVIVDSRTPSQNIRVSHSIFTQKYQSAGDPYDRIVEMPAFGHSDNHALVQAADLVASAFVFPMTVEAYCKGHLSGVHIRPAYSELQARYGTTIKNLQHRYQKNRRWTGGLTVSDGLNKRSGARLFGPSAPRRATAS